MSDTNLAGHLAERWWWRGVRPAVSLFAQSAAAGSLAILRGATDSLVRGGQYLGPVGRRETRGPPGPALASPDARDPELARHLWAESERLTAVTYG